MKLEMDIGVAQAYKSASQIARVVTEGWASANLYCAACPNALLACAPCNTKAYDFLCTRCGAFYQLKGGRLWNEARVPDAGYDAMAATISAGRTPNLLIMQYSTHWAVHNLLLIPSFFFTLSSIQKRKPLLPTARRAGWVGCNILLKLIAPDGKIRIVANGVEFERSSICQQYERVKPLAGLDQEVRGWTLDVLTAIRRLGRAKFSLADAYSFESMLSHLHPDNNNVKPKIRQQLQVLRDLGLLQFVQRGEYELVP